MRIYISHSIRGKYGKDATNTQMKANCDAIMEVANHLRASFFNNRCEFYVPAEHEDFVGIAYREQYLTEKQILNIDCKIIASCDAVIICVPEGDELNGGRKIEHDYAIKHNIPVCIFHQLSEAISWLTHSILHS